MSLVVVTGPASEPVTLDEAKAHLRVDSTADDALIARLVSMARADIEVISLHKLITQTWSWYFDAFPGLSVLELPLQPVQSVTGVYYTPEDGSEQTFASTNYLTDLYSTPARIALKSTASWPSDTLNVVNGCRVQFVVGFGDDPGDVDERARQALLLLLGHYYENREEIVVGSTISRLPLGVTALCMDLRMKAKGF